MGCTGVMAVLTMDMKAPIRVETMAPLMALTLVIHRPKCRKSGSAFISSPTANDRQPPASKNEKKEIMVNVNSFTLWSFSIVPSILYLLDVCDAYRLLFEIINSGILFKLSTPVNSFWMPALHFQFLWHSNTLQQYFSQSVLNSSNIFFSDWCTRVHF